LESKFKNFEGFIKWLMGFDLWQWNGSGVLHLGSIRVNWKL